MAEIPTITMWNQDGRPVRVNEDDKALQGKLRELGYEEESIIRSGVPYHMAAKPMEEIISQFRLHDQEPPPKTRPPEGPPEPTVQGEAAQDQAAGEVLLKEAVPSASKGEYYDIKTKTTKKK